jgi:hypothetical protein
MCRLCMWEGLRDEVINIVVFGGCALCFVDEGRGAGEGVVGFANEV